MLKTAATLKTFFGSFDLPAYMDDSVPEYVSLPYITYPLIEPEWGEQASFYCQIWYKKKQLGNLLAKADALLKAIGEGIQFEQVGGYIVIYPSTPLIQVLTDEETDRAYINLIIRAYHIPGD